MAIEKINALALDLVARDFSGGHAPSNGGPTKTSRALAILHLAARDAYAKVTSAYPPRLAGLPNKPTGLGSTGALGEDAATGAGIRAAALLYPDFSDFINQRSEALTTGTDPVALLYGAEIAEIWVASRQGDGAGLPQTDSMYNDAPGRHRRDPISQSPSLGRTWGQVKPFVLTNVAVEAPLGPPPALASAQYAKAYDDVFINGRNNIILRKPKFREQAAIGIFWGYDGANKLGTPPRLYNQVVVGTQEFQGLAEKDKVNVLAAINAAMADAGIAAWHWKYVYDFWRPVVAIREADLGFGPSGKGDGNALRKEQGDPFWTPLGAPKSNPIPQPATLAPAPGAPGSNFTPNFPAYPSGHATFGTACFEAFAGLVGKKADKIKTTFCSDEFSGATTDYQGVLRPRWEQTFTLQEAIEQNKISRIYLGVHWSFDAEGGDTVGKAIATKTVAAFK